MPIAVWIIVGLLVLYILFIVAPAIVGAAILFRKIDWCLPLKENPEPKKYYLPYMDRMIEAIDFFEELGGEDIRIVARDKALMYGQFFDAGSDKTVVMAHGFMTTAMESFAVSGKSFYERGYNVLIIDERAHGKSGGKRTSLGYLESDDLLEWANWISNRFSSGSIYLYGVSMGAFAVAMTADHITNPQIKGLIIDSAFASIKNQLMREYNRRRLPAPLLIPWARVWYMLHFKKDMYKSAAEALMKCEKPVYFIHGDADETVDFKQQEILYKACISKKELALVPGAAHTMGFTVGGTELENKIFNFLEGE